MNNIKTLTRCAMVAALGAAALMGCERRQDKYNRTTVVTPVEEPKRDLPPKGDELGTGGGPVQIGMALDQIVGARCDREMRCGNIGADKKFTDRNACMTEVKKDFADDLNSEDCPAGVDGKELGECLTEARNEDCANPFDTIGRVAACRTSDICRHVK